MFGTYQDLVLEYYRQKRTDQLLPIGLMHPTPANLKAACVAMCSEKYQRKDEKVLKDFFEKGVDRESFLQSIERTDIDKFRPLVNFLKEQTGRPKEKNIELLAWLIDFPKRPFDLKEKYEKEEDPVVDLPDYTPDDIPDACTRIPLKPAEAPSIPPTPLSKPTVKTRRVLVAAFLVAFFGFGVYWVWGNSSCMYWAGDHYEQIDCRQKTENTLMIALDMEKVNHFRKITNPDTITQQSIGLVWYVKYNGNYEYYTSGGYHPLDPNLRLKPITKYIISNHLAKSN